MVPFIPLIGHLQGVKQYHKKSIHHFPCKKLNSNEIIRFNSDVQYSTLPTTIGILHTLITIDNLQTM